MTSPYPFTINGNTYAESDFSPYGYVTAFPALMSDLATVVPAVEAVAANLTVRQRLTATLDLYVRPDGLDSNTGLANTAGGAWLTLQKAWDYCQANVDMAQQAVIVHVADGSYPAGVTAHGTFPGNSPAHAVTFRGNNTTPGNVIIAATGTHCFKAHNACMLIEGMTLRAGTYCLLSQNAAFIGLNGNVDFGTTTLAHMLALYGGEIELFGGYTISANVPIHAQADMNGIIVGGAKTITLTNTPVFSLGMMLASRNGTIQLANMTVTGSIGGGSKKYDAFGNGVVDTGGDSWTVGGVGSQPIPGSVAGTTSTGGQKL